jgi:hypothetical protein
MSGEVVEVNGNNLVVKMTNGELRTFNNVPDSRRAIVDGREVGVRELRPGTKLTATITRTMTPVTVRTTTVTTGRVWVASGNSVVLTLPNGENKQYVVRPDFQFMVNGRPATVTDLRSGMTVSAERIVEEPTVDIAVATRVAGQAPAAAAPSAGQAAAPVRGGGQAAAAAAQSGGQSAGAGAPAGAGAGGSGATAATLPKTASAFPLIGLLGLVLVAGSYLLRRVRRT